MHRARLPRFNDFNKVLNKCTENPGVSVDSEVIDRARCTERALRE
jgi:hypothetical protein